MNAPAFTVRTDAEVLRDTLERAKDGAWQIYWAEYTAGVDEDPGEARARYFETMERLDRAERDLFGKGDA